MSLKRSLARTEFPDGLMLLSVSEIILSGDELKDIRKEIC